MADDGGVFVSPSALKHLNRGKKRKTNMENWKAVSRKRKRERGEPYVSKRNVPVAAVKLPEKVGGTMLYLHRSSLACCFKRACYYYFFIVKNQG